MTDDKKATLMVKIHWFTAAVVSRDIANGVYENPETGEIKTLQARVVRRQFPDCNSWEHRYSERSSWSVSDGEMPKWAPVEVSRQWCTGLGMSHKIDHGYYKG